MKQEKKTDLNNFYFQGHWYMETPTKGSAYRCLHFTSKEVDPVFQQASDAAGVPFNELSVSFSRN